MLKPVPAGRTLPGDAPRTAAGAIRPHRTRLSPVTRRRLAIFRQHRRGYVCFWIFLVLFVISLFAEFIANDRPLLARFDGHWYFPVLENYSEDTFGPDFLPTETDYTDLGVQHAIRAHGWMIWPLIPYHYSTIEESSQPGTLAADMAELARH